MMRHVRMPTPAELRERVEQLPAARPLLERLPDEPRVHLVGGAVRDLLRGGSPTDLDLVVEGDAVVLAQRLGGELLAHDRFGTVAVRLDGFSYDIGRSRRESYERPGALPDVEPAPLAEDLTRRDFTVNAIALALTGSGAGVLSAAAGALDDLDARLLRVLHDRSFIDDPSRMLRLARYKSRLGFGVEPHTRALVDPEALNTVSGARVGAELRLLAREPDPVAALEVVHELGLDGAIGEGFGLRDTELARRALELLPDDGRRDLLVIAAASREVDRDRLDELAFEAADRDTIAAARAADAIAERLRGASRPSEIAAVVDRARPELVALAGALGAERAATDWFGRLRHVGLQIDGADLLKAGVPEGPAVGRGLRAALHAKLDGRASGRDEELQIALSAARD